MLFATKDGLFATPSAGDGAGSVTSVSVVTANGVSGSVANPTSTPAITLTLGAITPTSVNGNTITTGTGTLTIAASKVLTVSNSLTFTGTDTSSVAFSAGGTAAFINVAQVFTKQQTPVSAALTSSSNLTAWDVSANQNATYTLTENTTLSNPTNQVANSIYMIRIVQAASAKTLAFGGNYKFPGGFAPTVSTGNGAVDILTFRSNGTLMELIGLAQNVS